ncbi:MAG: putative selenate ABC transporter substrate-binding protein [Burkholderiaceae bacterium]
MIKRQMLQAVVGSLLAICLPLQAQSQAQAKDILRITTIPEEAASEQIRKFTPLAKYLEKRLGMKVEFRPVADYPAAVEALVNKQIDLAWLGGLTFVQADIRSGGKVVPILQREEDTKFRSVFISQTNSGIKKLSDLKGKTLTFGSSSSTSGHLMPRSYMLEAGLNPEKDLARVAYSGAHDASIAAVVSGRVDAAAVDMTVWQKFVESKRVDISKVNAFYETPTFFNYNWTIHQDMPPELRKKIEKAFLDLNDATPEGKEILSLARATRFIPTKAENYKGMEKAARSAGLIK